MEYGISNTKGRPSEAHVFDILALAKKRGIAELDTAEAYGDSHSIIGKYVKTNDVFLIRSKIQSLNENVKEQIDSLLLELKVDSLESLSLHSLQALEEAYLNRRINELIHDSRIKALGVSVYGNDEFERALEFKEVKLIQTPFNLLDNWTIRGKLIRKAKMKGVEIHARSSFLQGLFFLPEESFRGNTVNLLDRLREVKDLANENDLSLLEMALRYSLSFVEIDKVIFGVDCVEHLESNLRFAVRGALPRKIIDSINEVKVLNQDLLNPGLWR